jgi:1,4-alpha-glucan branching enzyme
MKRPLATVLCVLIGTVALHTLSTLGADEEVATTFKYTDPNATKVEVAGEFSNWKILPMTKGDGGTWTTTVHLKPGYYAYKFVVNGEWVLDPANPTRKTVNDIDNSAVSVGGVQPQAGGGGGSVSGKVPVTFTFSDPNAKSVHLAGEFNNWLDNVDGKVTGHNDWMLQNDGAGNWKLNAPLSPGKFKFKYVVNSGERWEKDRSLPQSADDNSLIEVKAGGAPEIAASGKSAVTFSYSSTSAKSVHIAGEFNKWLDNVDGKITGHNEWAMQNDGAGNWKLAAQLPPGRYKFKYVIDNGARWEQDPTVPASTDGNSIIEVKATAGQPAATAPTAVAAPGQGGVATTFTYADPTAKAVSVAGEFNRWSVNANPMQKDDSGIWTTSVQLKSGRYQYKFVVDGNWKEDPTNPESADDGLGGKNSVKVVAQ